MMEQAVQHGGDRGGSPRSLRQSSTAVGGHQCAGTLITTHDDLQQIFGCGEGKLAHTQVIENE